MFKSAFSPLEDLLQQAASRRSMVFSVLIVTALLAFEVFNFSTTDFAMTDLLGDLRFAGVRWATILAIAFCGIDFAGIARIFTPEQGDDEPAEIWYLMGAWLLAAAMNALLTWWGVSIAILSHDSLGNAVISRDTLLKVVPIFVAVMVWLSRIMIIGTFTVAGERLFNTAPAKTTYRKPQQRRTSTSRSGYRSSRPVNTYRPAPKSAAGKPRPNARYARPPEDNASNSYR